MTSFQAPTLNSFLRTDTNYVAKMNENVDAIADAFDSIAANLATVNNATGAVIGTDWYRRVNGSSPAGGTLGNSLVLQDDGSNQISLIDNPQSGSSVAIISGTRRSHAGNLTFDLETLGLSDASYTIYVGVDALSNTDLSIGVSTTVGDITVPLYELDTTVSGSGTVYTINRVRRRSETLIWDNTLEQARQAVPFVITTRIEGVQSTDDFKIQIPVDASLSRMWLYQKGDIGASTIYVKDESGTTTLLTWTASATMAAGDVGQADVSSDYQGVAFPAFTNFLIDFSTIGSAQDIVLGVEFVPQFYLPTQ